MPRQAKIAAVRASPARSQEIYQRYAITLYRQVLLNLDNPASAGHVACDALVNEHALAAMPGRGEDDARYRRKEAVFRRFRPMAARWRAVLRKLPTSPPVPAENSESRRN
jgi:hypothetical protein